MFSKSLFSTAILVLLSWSVLAGDARCSFKPYGRPKASDCIFIINHLIPVASFPEGWVIYGPSKPYIRLPLVYYFRTCLIYTMPRNLPPYDARHVWHMKMDELRFHVNDIVDLCMVHGEHGWPPHSGGNSVVAKDVLNGPLQIEIFGVPDYADLYERADLDDGGVMTGPTLEMRILEDYMNKARRPGAALEQAASDTSTKPAEPLQCRSCSVHHDCPFEGDYRCVADVKAFTNTRSLQGCCKLDTWSGSPGRRLLRSSPPVAANSANRAGAWGDHSCACNCTYVSPTCCGADDGIVSELPSVEIEALAPPTATTCCDRDTGLFAQGTARLNSTFC